jgi:hypothetical protein
MPVNEGRLLKDRPLAPQKKGRLNGAKPPLRPNHRFVRWVAWLMRWVTIGIALPIAALPFSVTEWPGVPLSLRSGSTSEH